jgi:hypothetical protein
VEERLRLIIEKHQVVYEHWSARVVHDGTPLAVGHDIVLIGTHGDHPKAMTSPGCSRCVDVWRDLEEVAKAVAPPPTRLSRARIVPFSGAVHYAREREERADIELVIEIRHQSNYSAPTDACEDECLSATLRRLCELGVPERKWRPGKPRGPS